MPYLSHQEFHSELDLQKALRGDDEAETAETVGPIFDLKLRQIEQATLAAARIRGMREEADRLTIEELTGNGRSSYVRRADLAEEMVWATSLESTKDRSRGSRNTDFVQPEIDEE